MRNPFFNPPGRPTITLPRQAAIVADVRVFLLANAATEEITDAQIIALAPEFATTPGLLSAIKQIMALV
jgi:hypothetical protein